MSNNDSATGGASSLGGALETVVNVLNKHLRSNRDMDSNSATNLQITTDVDFRRALLPSFDDGSYDELSEAAIDEKIASVLDEMGGNERGAVKKYFEDKYVGVVFSLMIANSAIRASILDHIGGKDQNIGTWMQVNAACEDDDATSKVSRIIASAYTVALSAATYGKGAEKMRTSARDWLRRNLENENKKIICLAPLYLLRPPAAWAVFRPAEEDDDEEGALAEANAQIEVLTANLAEANAELAEVKDKLDTANDDLDKANTRNNALRVAEDKLSRVWNVAERYEDSSLSSSAAMSQICDVLDI